jgi:F-type H+-transporting ATPase subunit delta
MIDPKEYGRALFLLSEERATTERVRDDLATVAAVLKNNPPYLSLMDTPAVGLAEKEGLIDRAFGALDTDVVSFLKILAGKHSLYAFGETHRAYTALYEASRGIERAEAVTAVAMSEAQRTALTEKLSRMTGKTILLQNTVDPSVLGGVKLRFLGRQLDGTLKTRLSSVERAIKDTIV